MTGEQKRLLAAQAIVAGIGFAALIGAMGQAWPHAATAAQPNGWTYPFSCCSGIDCREVADSAIGEGGQGYTIRATGERLAFGDPRLKDSPDGRFHWCSVGGRPDGRTICLFVPPRGF